jgi:hypothetical protein
MRGLGLLVSVLPVLSGCSPDSLASHRSMHTRTAQAPRYGFWGLNGFVTPEGLRATRDAFSMTIFHTATMDREWAVGELLPMVREAGLQVTLRLTGDHHHYTTGGDFDLEAWKRTLSRWEGIPLQEFIDDGTLAGHMLLDDIENFEGHDPDAAELDEMARFSRALLPGLMTFVRQKATAMPRPVGGKYIHLDAIVNQYKAAEGDVREYAATEAAAAAALGVGVINGLNIANGGDGSSGQPGWGAGKHAMSAEEIRRYGWVLSSVPECGMFLNWEYDGEERWSDGSLGSDYFDQDDRTAVLRRLGERVGRHRPVPLLKATPDG